MWVAHSVGFDDLGQFYRRFGVMAGAPPGTCRCRSTVEGTAGRL
jgi:hypothetical protein